MGTLKPGDLVRYIDDVGEGRVTRILKNGMVEIRTPDGWDIPVYANRLVFIPEETKASEKSSREIERTVQERTSKVKETAGDIKTPETGTGLFLSVSRLSDENKAFGGIRFNLINDTAYRISFAFYEVEKNNTALVAEDMLDDGMVLDLGDYPLERLSVIEGFVLQGILIKENASSLHSPVDFHLPFHARKFSSPGAYRSNEFLDEPAQFFRLDGPGLKEIIEGFSPAELLAAVLDKEKSNAELNKPKQFKPGNPDRIPIEVDLHINRLVDHVVGLSNQEIIKIQMDKFREELESAIIDNEREIVFIHGIGNGTLKNELRRAVETDYPFCSFEDASFKEYGFGATRILIRQNKPI